MKGFVFGDPKKILTTGASRVSDNKFTNSQHLKQVSNVITTSNVYKQKDSIPTDRTYNYLQLGQNNNIRIENMSDWQIGIYKRIVDGKDTIVSIQPSAGKTRPVSFYFFKQYLNMVNELAENPNNNRIGGKDLKRMLFVVPTKQLVEQMARSEFLKDLKMSIYAPFIQNIPNTNTEQLKRFPVDVLLPVIKQVYPTYFNVRNSNLQDIDIVERIWAEEMFGKYIGGSSLDDVVCKLPIGQLYNKPKLLTICTKDKILDLINSFGDFYQILFVDELQALLPNPGDDVVFKSDEIATLAKLFITIKRFKNPIFLMTGSVNGSSLQRMANKLNTAYGKKFEIHPDASKTLDELKARNRSNVKVIGISHFEKSNTGLADIIYNIAMEHINYGIHNAVILTFAFRFQSKTGIFNIVKKIIDSMPQGKPHNYFFDTDNSDKKTIRTMEDVQKYYSDDLVSKNVLIKVNDNLMVDEIEFLKYFNDKLVSDNLKGEQLENDAIISKKLENNILYQGVLRGVGFIIGGLPQQHKATIQKLFRRQKISVLFATDAVGVGANLNCKYLYLTTTSKFDGEKKSTINDSSLVQMINRAGRGAFPDAYIFCPILDKDKLDNLFNGDPRKTVSIISERNMQLIEQLIDDPSRRKFNFIDQSEINNRNIPKVMRALINDIN